MKNNGSKKMGDDWKTALKKNGWKNTNDGVKNGFTRNGEKNGLTKNGEKNGGEKKNGEKKKELKPKKGEKVGKKNGFPKKGEGNVPKKKLDPNQLARREIRPAPEVKPATLEPLTM